MKYVSKRNKSKSYINCVSEIPVKFYHKTNKFVFIKIIGMPAYVICTVLLE